MVHVTDVGHTCIIMLVLPSKFTLNKMKGIVQGNMISTRSFFTMEAFLTVQIHPYLWGMDTTQF